MGKGPYSEAAAYALGVFADAIQSAETRQKFVENFDRTLKEVLEDKGAKKEDLPQEVRTFLNGLSLDQLDLLAELQATMVKAGLYDTIDEPAKDAHHGVATLAKL
jgi:hypothetical protein